MNQQIITSNPLKAWLAKFLLMHGLSKPAAKPLYTYQLTEVDQNKKSKAGKPQTMPVA